MFGGVTGGGTDALVALFRTLGLNVFQSAFAQGLTSDPLDKTISYTIVFLILGALPLTVRTMYSRGETTVADERLTRLRRGCPRRPATSSRGRAGSTAATRSRSSSRSAWSCWRRSCCRRRSSRVEAVLLVVVAWSAGLLGATLRAMRIPALLLASILIVNALFFPGATDVLADRRPARPSPGRA